jgi:hypothetical protein
VAATLCALCVQVRCEDGPVVGTGDKPIGLEHLFYYPKYANVTVSGAVGWGWGWGWGWVWVNRAHTHRAAKHINDA